MSIELLDPRNDYVFKRIFAASPDLLADLINAVRSDEPPIEVVEVLNPQILPEDIKGKFIILDILAKDAVGHLYNIEMQVQRYNPWSARSTYYLARALTHQIGSGDRYASIKPVIGIHLLDFVLFPETPQALWCFEMRDRLQPDIVLGPELQLNIVELTKADQSGTLTGALADWVTYIEHWQEESRMNQITHPPVVEAMRQLYALSSSTEEHYRAEMRARAVIEEASQMEYAERRGLEKGREEGLEKGLEKGREEGRIATLRAVFSSLVAKGMDEAIARKIVGLTA
ncbi:MAG: Rpn family recombination-promoting nuclease/putative transposase [Rectinemataceae bacterium]|nr:Rpn family recombination-promoting nuclease/putative transposase [Rectinemataceae bacterium]